MAENPCAPAPGGASAIGSRASTWRSTARKLFPVAAFVEGVGDGRVAGLMTTGRVQSRLKHAVPLGACGVLAFSLLLPVR